MIKRGILVFLSFTVVLILFVIVIKTFILDAGQDEQEKLDNALLLGDVVVSMYREEVTPSSLDLFKDRDNYSEEVVKTLKEYQASLNSLDDEVFNLSEYYYENYEIYSEEGNHLDEFIEENPNGSLFEVAGDEDITSTEEVENYDDYSIEDSPFIYYEGDTALIKVKDLPFSEGEATLSFKGSTFTLLQVNVPQTYTAIKEDTKYLYSYTDYMFDKESDKFVDLQYTSIANKEEVKIIRIFLDKRSTITGFKVR